MSSPQEADHSSVVVLDGSSLSIETLTKVARDPRIRVEVEAGGWLRVAKAQKLVERVANDYRESKRRRDAGEEDVDLVLDYGVTTGFGEFKNIAIDPDSLRSLQRNILLSHATGVGESADFGNPASYFAAEVVRAALVIRLNAFLKGHSGVRRELVEILLAMVNGGIVPLVPTRGSVGSSGDLCPLSHMAAVLLGYGHFYVVAEPGDLLAGRPGELLPAKGLLKRLGR
jgi:histidine ammonia-lyase